MSVTPFPFATVAELKARWSKFPAGQEATATLLLEDASQFILDIMPSAATATAITRRRVAIAVVKRSMEAEANEMGGLKSLQVGTGPFQDTLTPTNPDGDFYLTAMEQKSLGKGRQRAFSVSLIGDPDAAD